METITINNQAYSKNVKLINSLSFICAWEIINRFECNIQTIADIKDALTVAVNKAKVEVEAKLASYKANADMDFDGYYERNYENACESWSCYGLDLDKLSN